MATVKELEAELKRDKPDPQTLTRHVDTLAKNRSREHELEACEVGGSFTGRDRDVERKNQRQEYEQTWQNSFNR